MARLFAAILAVAALSLQSALAEDDGFDPQARCADVFALDYERNVLFRTGWAIGYLSAKSGDLPYVDRQMFESVGEMLGTACEAAPDTSFIDLVEAVLDL